MFRQKPHSPIGVHAPHVVADSQPLAPSMEAGVSVAVASIAAVSLTIPVSPPLAVSFMFASVEFSPPQPTTDENPSRIERVRCARVVMFTLGCRDESHGIRPVRIR